MKFLILLFIFSTIACENSSKKNAVQEPVFEKIIIPMTLVETVGKKCQLTSRTENLPIFMTIQNLQEGLEVKLYEFANEIKENFVTFEGHKLHRFLISKDEEKNNRYSGEALISHLSMNALSQDGEVVGLKAKLTIKDDGEGEIQRSLKLLKSEARVMNTRFQRLALITNCEKAKAFILQELVEAK